MAYYCLGMTKETYPSYWTTPAGVAEATIAAFYTALPPIREIPPTHEQYGGTNVPNVVKIDLFPDERIVIGFPPYNGHEMYMTQFGSIWVVKGSMSTFYGGGNSEIRGPSTHCILSLDRYHGLSALDFNHMPAVMHEITESIAQLSLRTVRDRLDQWAVQKQEVDIVINTLLSLLYKPTLSWHLNSVGIDRLQKENRELRAAIIYSTREREAANKLLQRQGKVHERAITTLQTELRTMQDMVYSLLDRVPSAVLAAPVVPTPVQTPTETEEDSFARFMGRAPRLAIQQLDPVPHLRAARGMVQGMAYSMLNSVASAVKPAVKWRTDDRPDAEDCTYVLSDDDDCTLTQNARASAPAPRSAPAPASASAAAAQQRAALAPTYRSASRGLKRTAAEMSTAQIIQGWCSN